MCACAVDVGDMSRCGYAGNVDMIFGLFGNHMFRLGRCVLGKDGLGVDDEMTGLLGGLQFHTSVALFLCRSNFLFHLAVHFWDEKACQMKRNDASTRND